MHKDDAGSSASVAVPDMEHVIASTYSILISTSSEVG